VATAMAVRENKSNRWIQEHRILSCSYRYIYR